MSHDKNDSIAIDKQIDAECDRFELAWLQGNRISIESILDANPDGLRDQLASELIAIELDLRQRADDPPNMDEYRRRFPGIAFKHPSEFARRPRQRSFGGDQATLDSPVRMERRNDDRTGELIRYIGDYEILDLIARGGMGVVYRARQRTLGRIVALKMIRGGQFAENEDIDRFRSEATAAAKLDHPGIVPVYEVGEQNGHHFYSMGYVEGGSLAGRMLEGPLPNQQCAELLSKIADAVHYAHEHGVIHRDIKPANILLDQNGQPRVTDFGLAKISKGSSDLTRSGQVLGTPSFMPPEQAASQANAVSPASDVYSLGALLYAMLTGRPPFQAATPIETLLQVQKQEPVSPRQFNANISIDLETITLKCLDKSPARRYPSAQALSQELHRYLDGKPILARPVSSAEHLWRWCRRNPVVAAMASIASILLIALTIGSVWAYLREVSFQEDLKDALQQETLAKNDAIQAKEEEQIAKNEANDAARRADEARIEKERQAAIAEQEKERAKASEAATRRNLYVADAARVDSLIKESNLVRAKSILERHIPTSPDEEDLRGFDWYYHWNQVKQEKAKFQFKKPVETICLSRDERTLAVGCEGGRVYLLDLETQKIQKEYPFFLNEEHWSTLAFVGEDRLVGHGQQGSFKLWNLSNGETIAHKPAYNEGTRTIEGRWLDRIPACCSHDGTIMVGCDSGNCLALWSLESLRPKALPFVNEGLHTTRVGQRWSESHFYLNPLKLFPMGNVSLDRTKLDSTGSLDWEEFSIQRAAENVATGYKSVGVYTSLPNLRQPSNILGHPISSLDISRDGKWLAAGSVTGEVQLWNIEKLSNPKQWKLAKPQRKLVSKLPITDIEVSEDQRWLVVCDARSIQVLALPELVTVASLPSGEGRFTKVCFLEPERIAFGTSTSLLGIWDWDSKRQPRFLLAGQGAVTDMLFLRSRSQLNVANADGAVRVFGFDRDEGVIPVSRPGRADEFPITWLSTSKKIAIVHDLSSSLTVVDPSDPENAIEIDLKQPGTFQIALQDYRTPVSFFERPKFNDIVSLHSQEINLWNASTWELIRNLDYTQHSDQQGRIHTMQATVHRIASFEFESERFSVASRPREAKIGNILHADLFADESRMAMLLDGPSLHVLIKDLNKNSIELETRIHGLAAVPGQTSIACLSRNRLLVHGVRCSADPPKQTRNFIWHLDDNHFSDMAVSSADFDKNNDRMHLINRDRDCQRLALWSRRSIHVFDSGENVTFRDLPVNEDILFATIDRSGVLLAAIQSRDGFRWSRWDEELKDWHDAFQSRLSFESPAANFQWCFDESRSTLFRLEKPGQFQRWNTSSGNERQPMGVSPGSIEQVSIDQSGAMLVLLKTKSSQFQSPWSLVWSHQNRTQTWQCPALLGGGRPQIYPNIHAGGFWVEGQVYPANKNMVQFQGSPLLPQMGAEVILSQDTSTLVQCRGGSISIWQRQKPSDPNISNAFAFVGTHPTPNAPNSFAAPFGIAATAVGSNRSDRVVPISPDARGDMATLAAGLNRGGDRLIGLSSNGSRIAIRTASELYWAKTPFEKWTPISATWVNAALVTAIQWSHDNTKLALGMNTGDTVIYDSTNDTAVSLARGHQGKVNDFVWMPDERTLASAGADGRIVLWDLELLELRMRLDAHRGAVHSLSLDVPNGTLVSGGADGKIRKWCAPRMASINGDASHWAAPDPDRKLREIKSHAPPYVVRNRELAKWLAERRVEFSFESLGMPARGNSNPFMELDEFSVSGIAFGSNPIATDADMERLTGLRELRSLKLVNCKLTIRGLGKLTGLESLVHLDLSGIDLTSFDFDVLRESSNLRTLRLLHCNVSHDQMLDILRLFPELEELEILGSPITDASIATIDQLRRLKTLRISVCPISDRSLSAISRLERIEQLDLSNTSISGEQLQPLASLKSLQTLRLASLNISDAFLEKLPDWKQLKKLDVRNTVITPDATTKFIAEHPQIELYVSSLLFGNQSEIVTLLELGPLRGSVEVDGKSLPVVKAIQALKTQGSITGLTWPIDPSRSHEDIALLMRLPKLQRLQLSRDVIPRVHFPLLPQIASLRELGLSNVTSYSRDDFQYICSSPSLRKLTLNTFDNKQDLGQLKRLWSLDSLHYARGFEIDELAKEILNLRSLSCPKIKLTALKRAIPFLKSLEVLTMLEVPEKGIGPVLAGLPNLKRVVAPSGISSQEFTALQKALPGIEVIRTSRQAKTTNDRDQ
jgi:serine/threonine protein kinase/WD40 repeat protein